MPSATKTRRRTASSRSVGARTPISACEAHLIARAADAVLLAAWPTDASNVEIVASSAFLDSLGVRGAPAPGALDHWLAEAGLPPLAALAETASDAPEAHVSLTPSVAQPWTLEVSSIAPSRLVVRIVPDHRGSDPWREPAQLRGMRLYRRPAEALADPRLAFRTEIEDLVVDLRILADLGGEFACSLHPDDEPRLVEALIRHRDEGAEIDCDFRYVQALTGRQWWLRQRGSARTEGGVRILEGYLLDITREKLAEEALARGARRLNDIADASSLWIWETAADGRIVYSVGKLARFVGQSPEAIVGHRLFDFMPADDAGHLERAMARRREERSAFEQLSMRITNGRGEERHVALSGMPVFAGDDFVGYRGVAIDITARHRAEEALRAAKEYAELANRTKTDFLANVSHELRTPLNAIIGFSEILASEAFGPLGSARYQEYVGDIRMSGVHLLELINDILDMAKVEAGKLELREERVQLAAAVHSCIRLVRDRAEENGLTLSSSVPADLPLVRADEGKIKQILINLLSNAVKFTPPGGRVEVHARVNHEGGLIVEVADTGIGIAQENIEHVLSPFGQVDSQLSRRHEGTGLGLPIAKALTELHQGTFDLTSEVGLGTTVSVEFPPERLLRPRG